MGSGKASEEEKDEAKVRKGERQVVDQVDTVEGGVPGARRRWRLAKNMLVASRWRGRRRIILAGKGDRRGLVGEDSPSLASSIQTWTICSTPERAVPHRKSITPVAAFPAVKRKKKAKKEKMSEVALRLALEGINALLSNSV